MEEGSFKKKRASHKKRIVFEKAFELWFVLALWHCTAWLKRGYEERPTHGKTLNISCMFHCSPYCLVNQWQPLQVQHFLNITFEHDLVDCLDRKSVILLVYSPYPLIDHSKEKLIYLRWLNILMDLLQVVWSWVSVAIFPPFHLLLSTF